MPLVIFALMSFLFTAARLDAQSQPVSPAPQDSQSKSFDQAKIEQLVAPVALFPDGLLAQILAASTYPVDVVEAARWVSHNPSLSQEDMKSELTNKSWDPSVKAMVFFPKMLERMNDNLDWTKELGEAFLAQQKDVMDAIQSLRSKAKAAGTLASDSNQTVSQGDTGIEIASTSPETVYVQNYIPATSYGTAWAPGPWFYPGIVLAGAWPWRYYGSNWAVCYGCSWRNGWIAYNNNFYNNHFINPYKYNSNNLYSPDRNSPWSHDYTRSRYQNPSVNNIANELRSEERGGQFNGENRSFRPQTGANPGSRDFANPADRPGNVFSSPDRFDPMNEGYDHAFAGTRNADFDRSCSERGYYSRSGSYGSYHGGSSYHGSGGYHGGGGSHGGGGRR